MGVIVAVRFLFLFVLAVGSGVLAVNLPRGSNPRRLVDQADNNNSTSKGQGIAAGQPHNDSINRTDVKDKGNTEKTSDLTPPPKNKNPTNTTEKGKSSDKEKRQPGGSQNKTDATPENTKDPQNDSSSSINSPTETHLTPPAENKGSKDSTHNATDSFPPVKNNQVPPKKKKEHSDADGEKEKSPAKDSSRESLYPQGCDESLSCTDEKKKMVACLRASGNAMQELSLLIQNKGEDSLHVDIKAPAFLKVDTLKFTLGKVQSKLVQVLMVDQVPHNLSLSKIVINGGKGECLLDVPNELLNSPYKQRFFEGISYSAIITPIFGMYLLLFTVLAIGGSWMCCKFWGKRRHGDGIRYQELEMNLPESTLPISTGGKPEAENMDGWDEVWDDSWEDAEAARSSSRPIQSLSSKGLAARRSNKDGWDNSWDD